MTPFSSAPIDDDGPADHLPHNRKGGRESEPRCGSRGHRGADQHEHEGHENEHGKRHRQGDRDEPALPPGTPFCDVVGAIQGIDHPNHGRRAAPDGADDPEGKKAAVAIPRNLVELPAEDRHELLRGDGIKGDDQLEEGVVDGQVADKRHQKEDRGKEREQKIEGELRHQSQTIVVANLVNRALDNVCSASWRTEVRKQQRRHSVGSLIGRVSGQLHVSRQGEGSARAAHAARWYPVTIVALRETSARERLENAAAEIPEDAGKPAQWEEMVVR